ncbi:uncharacterized protein L201_000053 [Kwoniella dendrophila CBS 6074]|uniref:N-acetyltransferase domain-containing protein n=1 Tax=Kwoniella dendrophila CBS 6074 TaxID=1295534 RepID=A0AAX4JKA0_9TREE
MEVTLPANQGTLSYRIATEDDRQLLLDLREECGWGKEKINAYLGNPDRPFCIFYLDKHTVVGMGGWIIHNPNDLEAANREKGSVYISSLFIRHAYQRKSIGTKAMDLLERTCEDEFGAKIITLDTTAYHVTIDEDDFRIEHPDIRGRSIAFYERRGYKEYREPKPTFPQASFPDSDRLLTAVFMSKPATTLSQ